MPAPRIGQMGQKYHEPHGQHDDDHGEVARQMQLHAAPDGGPPGGAAARVVAPQLGHRQVGGQRAQVVGGLRGEGGLQAVLVLRHVQIALGECLAEQGGGRFAVAVAGAGGGGHASLAILTVTSSTMPAQLVTVKIHICVQTASTAGKCEKTPQPAQYERRIPQPAQYERQVSRISGRRRSPAVRSPAPGPATVVPPRGPRPRRRR